MAYELSFSDRDDDERSELTIKDGEGERSYRDGGCPEDNYYFRDWSWVHGELEQAYKQGLIDGKQAQS